MKNGKLKINVKKRGYKKPRFHFDLYCEFVKLLKEFLGIVGVSYYRDGIEKVKRENTHNGFCIDKVSALR